MQLYTWMELILLKKMQSQIDDMIYIKLQRHRYLYDQAEDKAVGPRKRPTIDT